MATLGIGICEEVSVQDCGWFLRLFGDLLQHAWRKMAEYGSQELRGLMKVLEDDSKLAQLSFAFNNRLHLLSS